MITNKIRVGILFGGQSAEHEISLQSARHILENIDHEKYHPFPIGIDKQGHWFFLSISDFFCFFEKEEFPTFTFQENLNEPFSPCMLCDLVDVVFPILHGPYGEDGSVQGLLKLANLPFVGADILSSALCMDKEITKRLLRDADLPIPHFRSLKIGQPIDSKLLLEEFRLPLFVKPANLGSSVGISKVHSEDELLPAIHQAFQYDEKVLVETYIEGREIECCVLGNFHPKVSLPGEIIPQHEFYSYEAKYLDQEGVCFKIPAPLDAQTTQEIQQLALQAFVLLQCEGMARVDFFLSQDGTLFLNEINTIPGFTAISLYPKLWEHSGISQKDLIDRLIELAFERHRRKKVLKADVYSNSFSSK